MLEKCVRYGNVVLVQFKIWIVLSPEIRQFLISSSYICLSRHRCGIILQLLTKAHTLILQLSFIFVTFNIGLI
jgi:hypothetical protein